MRTYTSLAMGLILVLAGSIPADEVAQSDSVAVEYTLMASGQEVSKGSILFEYYWGTNDYISSLLSLPTYPDKPDQTELRTSLEGLTNWRDNYGTRVRGYLYPPATGAFTFWIASDDQSELWLSPDEDAAKAVCIASVAAWTPSRDFDNTGGGAGGPQQRSGPISLAVGQRYYIQVLHVEDYVGDNLAVAWQGPGIPTRAVIEGQYLAPVSGQGDGIDPTLVAHWKLDEASGTVAYDSVGEKDGVLYNGPVWQPTGGKTGGSLKFDGSNDYVALPIGSLIGSLTNSTFATWVNWSGTGGLWQRVFDFGSGTSVNMFTTPTNLDGRMRFAITTGGAGAEDQTTAMAPLPTGWHHVAVTMDAVNKTHTLYLDGQAAATKTATRYTPSSLGNTTENWLGRSQYVDPYLNGSLDDFRIYNRVLSQAEVGAIAGAASLTWNRAAYWDSRYPACWAGGIEATRDALAAAGYTILNADELKTWMDARIADKKLSVVVFCKDIVPDTVAETMSATCTLRRYLDAGGKIVWYADIPFFQQGHANGTDTEWGDAGAPAILGFNTASAPRGSKQTVTLTPAGIEWGLTQTWQSERPAAPGVTGSLTILATDNGGNAAAWAKHYVADDDFRGFVRFRDTSGQPLVADIIHVAEYISPRGANPLPITLNPASGTVGTKIAITGTGFAPNAFGQVFFDSNRNGRYDSGEPSQVLTTKADGTFTTDLTVPPVVDGAYAVYADLLGGSAIEASATFTVGAAATATEVYVWPGSAPSFPTYPLPYPFGLIPFDVSGSGFAGNTQVRVSFDTNRNGAYDSGEPSQDLTTTAGGTFGAEELYLVPREVAAGIYPVLVDCPIGGPIEGSTTFVVVNGPGIYIHPRRSQLSRFSPCHLKIKTTINLEFFCLDTNGNGIRDSYDCDDIIPNCIDATGGTVTISTEVPIQPGTYNIIGRYNIQGGGPFSVAFEVLP